MSRNMPVNLDFGLGICVSKRKPAFFKINKWLVFSHLVKSPNNSSSGLTFGSGVHATIRAVTL